MSAAEKMPWKTGAGSGHITNLKQSIFGDYHYLWLNPAEIDLTETKTVAYYITVFFIAEKSSIVHAQVPITPGLEPLLLGSRVKCSTN